MCNKNYVFANVEGFGSSKRYILFREIYILFDFTFIQWIAIKDTEIIIVSHFHETRVKTIMTVVMKVNRCFKDCLIIELSSFSRR